VKPTFESVHPASTFVSTVLDGAPNPCPAQEAVRAATLTAAIYQSVAEGCMVQL
jgi:hypothetical protein